MWLDPAWPQPLPGPMGGHFPSAQKVPSSGAGLGSPRLQGPSEGWAASQRSGEPRGSLEAPAEDVDSEWCGVCDPFQVKSYALECSL